MTLVVGPELYSGDSELITGSDRNRVDLYGPLFETEQIPDFNGRFGISKLKKGDETVYTFAVHVSSDVQHVDFCVSSATPGVDQDMRWSLSPVEQESANGSTVYAGQIPGLLPGDLYGIRVDRYGDNGDYDTLLLDPYAKAMTRAGHPDHPESPAYGVVVEDDPLTPRSIERPHIDPKDRVIYEVHIRDSTFLNPDIPNELRGTYEGFSHPAHIKYLKELGVTTVELLPIMQFFSEKHLADTGKTNHWGYNTAGFFAPHEGYARCQEPGAAVQECKAMIDALHEAGIEVVLDVVYNHTADAGMQSERTYSLRGLDNEGYYQMCTGVDGKRYYYDSTGCGNTVDTSKPAAAKLIRDSMTFWHHEMGVDGFRFDLASSLTQDPDFFKNLRQDPDFSECLLVAEPWNIHHYPRGIMQQHGVPEWDGEFRNLMREFWGNGRRDIGAFATFLANLGYINIITTHDGFTLNDWASYNSKHNMANGENDRDGSNDNRSHNHGVEGETDDPQINHLREVAIRNLALTQFMAIGTPMIVNGDEKRKTQSGNNNPYCQDNETTWRNWDLTGEQEAMRQFVQGVIALRKRSGRGDQTVNMGNLTGSPIDEMGVDWFNLWGLRMQTNEWHGDPILGMYSSGQAGEEEKDSVLYYVNGTDKNVTVSLPKLSGAQGDYEIVADTETGRVGVDEGLGRVATTFTMKPRTSVVMRRISSRLPESQLSPSVKPATLNLNYPHHNYITLTHPSQTIIHSSDDLVEDTVSRLDITTAAA